MNTTAKPANGPVEILVVEDSPTQAQQLQHILEQQGYHVTATANGQQALKAAQCHKPTLIISDVVMPEMDGYELCRRVKADAGLGDTPVILVTTLSDPQDVIRGLECRADNFILKPYDERHLLNRVRFVLVNREVRQAEPAGMGVEIFFNGQKHFITADRLQILNLLLSTYEAAVQRNNELRQSQGELQRANSELQQWMLELEARVLQRAQELERVSRALGEENAGRQRLEAQFIEAKKIAAEARSEQAVMRMEQAEARSEQSESANLAKSQFLSNMSHELRSPLNAILGFAQLMESASPSPTASQTKSIAQILQAGWYLLKLINEILDLAAIESGKVPLSKESVSLSQVMSECQSMMEPQAQERGIRMTFPQFDKPVFVSADRTRLKQIVINLVSNAIKYNQAQGTVVVDCTVIAAPSSDFGAAGPERIRFSVKDSGPGLPPEKLAQLFEPFNRLGREAGSVAGTGIGLVVSKRLAELMGGTLGVESTVGVGSVFWCELLSDEAPQIAVRNGDTEALRRLESSADAARRTLLYVEDNPANMKLIEELIARFPNLRLMTAVNGTLGIELARVTPPTVILMDINLPGISGIKALKILREDPATAHIPIIALSANAMPRDIAKGLKAGFFRYLTKPIKIQEFIDTLNEALEFAEKRPGAPKSGEGGLVKERNGEQMP